MQVFKQAVFSIFYFFRLVFAGFLHLQKDKLWTKYRVIDGKTYTVFRKTVSDKDYNEKEVTLIIGFRLKFIGSNPFVHWLFQLFSLLDTPIWVGFPGFRTKFWMVQPKTKDYLGLYRYQGKENAKRYAAYITSILRPVSTKNSVWYEFLEEKFESYIKNKKVT